LAIPLRLQTTKEGYLHQILTPPSGYLSVPLAISATPEVAALNFIKAYAPLLGIDNKAVAFKTIRSETKVNRTYLRFAQTYSGLPVFGAQMVIHLNGVGGITYLLSNIARDFSILEEGKLVTSPSLSAERATAKVRGLIEKSHPDVKLKITEPKLALFDPSLLRTEGHIRLVWVMDVSSSSPTYLGEQILLDAQSGQIIRQYPHNKASLFREVSDASNTSIPIPSGNGRSEGGSPTGTPDIDHVYDYLGDAYSFYMNKFGRDSLDDDGMTLRATVKYCSTDPNICSGCPCNNSYWSGDWERLFFGQGQGCIDVVGHEFTHGVEAESMWDIFGVLTVKHGFVYEGQSGALSESFSDIFGEFIEQTSGKGTTGGRWLMGENCTGGPFRSMKDPPKFGQPDFLSSPNYYHGGDQYLGVHQNDGVVNKLAFLLTDGGTFRDWWHVSGIGVDRVAALYYEALVHYLGPTSGFNELYRAMIQVASDSMWTYQEMNNLYRACKAVEITAGERDVYVDGSSDCEFSENGDNWCDQIKGGPFKTIENSLNFAFPGSAFFGDTLHITAGAYDEKITFDRVMEIKALDGMVTIGSKIQ
jgi:Zn-dependent metalloprotease